MFMQRNVAYLLLITMLALIALGLVMLSSTSSVLAASDMPGLYSNVYSNLRRQCIWLGVGGAICVLLSRYDYQRLLRFAPWLVGFSCLLLVLCFIKHIGATVNGSPRWLKVDGLTYQPSELAKIALIFFLAWWLGKNEKSIGDFKKGFLIPFVCALPLLLLVTKQQDFGTTAIMLAILVIIFFCAGTPIRYLLPVPLIGFAGLILGSLLVPERRARWEAFFHMVHGGGPVSHAIDEKARQQLQALIAFGSGGLSGLGLGNSRQKMFYLPEVNTDFVFPIIGEELGMWMALAVVLCFLILTLCGGWITIHAPDRKGVLLGTGVTVMIALQALMNFAVVTSLMPCKGISLPFISYGGSNLLTCLAGVGLLFNIHRQGVYESSRAPALVAKPYSVRM
jgi:cell division protein FtsW